MNDDDKFLVSMPSIKERNIMRISLWVANYFIFKLT